MIDIEDKTRKPDEREISELVANPLFDELGDYLLSEYAAIRSIEYSGDRVLLGWNVKFKKAGRTLCTLYPRARRFKMLLVVGRKEKERVEARLPRMSAEFQKIYRETPEGMGQRWLLLEFCERSPLYDDALAVIRIRRESR